MGAQMNGSQEQEFEQHHQEQLSQIFSDFNRHITTEKLGRTPTDNELLWNFIYGGGAKALAVKNGRDIEGADL